MSEHSAAEHGHGTPPDAGGHGGHDEHGHGQASGQWVDYNAQPPARSTLPIIPAFALVVMALVLAVLLSAIVNTSLVLAAREARHAHTEEPAEKTDH